MPDPNGRPAATPDDPNGDDPRGRWMLTAILTVFLVTAAVLAIVLVDDAQSDADGTAGTDQPAAGTPETDENDATPRPDPDVSSDVDCTQVTYSTDAGPTPSGWDTTMRAPGPDDPPLPDTITGVLGVFDGETTDRAIVIADGWDDPPADLTEPLSGPAPVESTEYGSLTWSEVSVPGPDDAVTACRITIVGIGTTPDDLSQFSSALAPEPATP